MPTVLHACDGTAVLVDAEDAERLAPVLTAGVRLQVHRPSRRPLRVILREYLPDGTSATVTLARAILNAGPLEEVGTAGDPLDHRRANLWRRGYCRRAAWRSKFA